MSEYSREHAIKSIASLIGDSKNKMNILNYLNGLPQSSRFYKLEMNTSRVSRDCIKQLIGKDGFFFKDVTERNSLDFIWYNQHTRKIEVWGQIETLYQGAAEIDQRLLYILDCNYRRQMQMHDNQDSRQEPREQQSRPKPLVQKVETGNTYATWTRGLNNIPEDVKDLGYVVGNGDELGQDNHNFSKTDYERLIQSDKNWKSINPSDLDVGGGAQSKLRKGENEHHNKIFKDKEGPFLTGGTIQERLATCHEFLREGVSKARTLRALYPEVESRLTYESVRPTLDSLGGGAMWALGTTDGHIGKCSSDMKFLPNLGFKGLKKGNTLEKSIDIISQNLAGLEGNLWVAGCIPFLLLNEDETFSDLYIPAIKSPNTIVQFSSGYLIDRLDLFKTATRKGKPDELTRYNAALFKGVLQRLGRSVNVIFGSRM